MHSFICNHQSMRLSDSMNIFLALSSASLIRVGRWGGFSSHKVYTPPLYHMLSSNGGCYLYKVISPTTWTSGEIIEGSVLILRVSTRFWGFRYFWGSSKIFQGPCGNFRTNCLEVFLLISCFSSLIFWLRLFILLWFPCVVIGGFIIFPFVPYLKGIIFPSKRLTIVLSVF